MKLRKILALSLAMILSVSLLAGCNEDTSEGGETTTEATAAETTTEAEETTTAVPEEELPVLNVAVGEMQNVLNPVFATAAGDKEISDLIHIPLLTIDRSGEVLYAASV